MGKQVDFEELAVAALSQVHSLVESWLPGGRRVGAEYVCADFAGGSGESLSINTNTGRWAEFAGTARGSDLISLYAAIHSIGQGEAARKLASEIGYTLGDKRAATRTQMPEIKLGIPPKGTSEPAMNIIRFGDPSSKNEAARSGEPVAKKCYRDSAGRVMFYVARYDPPNGKKQFVPWSWSLTDQKWVQKGWPAPRPLYGLDRLAAKPNSPVLIVEGEKAADALHPVASPYAVVTWPNGASAADKVNWEPIYGRKVLIWPDADEPGRQAAMKIAARLVTQCPEVKVIDTPHDAIGGWDAADAIADGWNWNAIVEWAKQRVRTVQPPKEAELLPPAAPAPPAEDDDDNETENQSWPVLWAQLGLAKNKNELPIMNADNVLRVLTGWRGFRDVIWFDEFHNKLFTKWQGGEPREWSDVDEIDLMIYLQRYFGFSRVSREMVAQAVVSMSRLNIKNEPRDWVSSLTWDGKPRIDTFFPMYFGSEESEYAFAVSRCWWLGMVARIFTPGCKVDNMVIIEGPQGKMKSSALGIIGGEWYAETGISILSKEFAMSIQGKLIVEIAELHSFSGKNINGIKSVISARKDRFRELYGKNYRDFPRRCIIVGTTNEDEYLEDATGGRRFWPVKTTGVELEQLKLDRDQLFAEAAHRFKQGENWWDVHETTLDEQQLRQFSDAWEQVISSYVSGREEVTVIDIATAREGLNIEVGNVSKATQMRVASVLKNLGWKKLRILNDGKRAKVWVRRE